ncbi:hypothetical protein A0H81_12661 [Grifola frondosa]|uniref:CCHC-type domain-containing protein n=1 Tax=Grifola frondosa TaxID=5627 RepID=A0A1C7LRN3_GRIFR|nr:hypothetical protein A0H81_12661 [Grifola frondosa]
MDEDKDDEDELEEELEDEDREDELKGFTALSKPEDPYSPDLINETAESILSRDRFDTERLDSDGIDRQNFEFDSDISSDEGSDEEDVPRKRLPKKQSTKRTKRRTVTLIVTRRTKKSPSREPLPKLRSSVKKKEAPKDRDVPEIDRLVQQMNKLSIDDPKYGQLFLQASAINPLVAQCLQMPRVNQLQNTRQQEISPPRYDRPDPGRFLDRRPYGPGCYGCGEPGHIVGNCPSIQEMLVKGFILKDYRGRITDMNGSILRKDMNENWVQAIRRIVPNVHFITYGKSLIDSDDESDPEVMVLPVEKSQRETRSYRKQVFDSVKVPMMTKGKQREFIPRQTPPLSQPVAAGSAESHHELRPVEVHQRNFDPDNDAE